MIRLGILGSTRGTHLEAIMEAINTQQLAAEVAVVVSNKSDAPLLGRAANHALPAIWVGTAELTRDDYDERISAVMQQHQVELIVLIGYMRILSAAFVTAWEHRIINVHPSLLPAFAGKMDLDVHRAVLEAGVVETGCTVHYVTQEVDAGPIIVQQTCAVLPQDTPEMLKERVQQLEGRALVEAIRIRCAFQALR